MISEEITKSKACWLTTTNQPPGRSHVCEPARKLDLGACLAL